MCEKALEYLDNGETSQAANILNVIKIQKLI